MSSPSHAAPPAGAWPANGLEATDCPACGAAEHATMHAGLRDRTFFSAPGAWRIVRCGGCGSGYLDERPSADTIALAYARYFTHSEQPGAGGAGPRAALANGLLNARWGYDARPALAVGALAGVLAPSRAALVARDVRHLAGPGGRLLDVGSGSGAYLARMRELGWDVEGVEPDGAAVAVARGAGLDVTEGTASDVTGEERFDAVTLSHVIEHLHRPGDALAQVRRLLRPGGTLWIATPNLQALGHRRFGRDWLHLDPPRHLVLFTHASLAGLLRRSGFEPIDIPTAAPQAWATFSQSAAIRAGRLPGAGPAAGARRLRALAALADRLARAQPRLAEELVVVARRQPSSSR